MYSKVLAGTVAGLIAGVVFGIMMTMMTAPTPDGRQMPMMTMVAQIVGSTSLAVGWIYHLFNSAVIGGLFGWVLGGRVHTYSAGLGWGALYGVFWWVLGGLVLMPLLLGMSAFTPLMMEAMRMTAMGSLVGHLLFGLILGGGYVLMHHEPAGTPHPVH
jgi:hypothetical protein